jgi:hypothetical protein
MTHEDREQYIADVQRDCEGILRMGEEISDITVERWQRGGTA